MDLSIVILNYKTKNLVKQCIKGIKMQNLPMEHETIVVDNASGDDVGDMLLEKFPDIKFIQSEENQGYAAGNNLGIKQAQGRYILILNPDVAVWENSIERLHKFMEENRDVAVAGPKLINPDKTRQYSCYRFPRFLTPIYRRTPLGKLSFAKKDLENYLMKDFDHGSNKEVDWLLGACWLVRKEAIDKVGLMDERFFLYFEDIDWCKRFWQSGYKVYYVPEAKMVHYHERLSAQESWTRGLLNQATRTHVKSWLKYFLKYKNEQSKQTTN